MEILITDIAGFVNKNKDLVRHSRADGNPEKNEAKDWIPAFAMHQNGAGLSQE